MKGEIQEFIAEAAMLFWLNEFEARFKRKSAERNEKKIFQQTASLNILPT